MLKYHHAFRIIYLEHKDQPFKNIFVVSHERTKLLNVMIRSFIHLLTHLFIHSPLILINVIKYSKTWTLLNKILLFELNGCVYTRQQPIV